MPQFSTNSLWHLKRNAMFHRIMQEITKTWCLFVQAEHKNAPKGIPSLRSIFVFKDFL